MEFESRMYCAVLVHVVYEYFDKLSLNTAGLPLILKLQFLLGGGYIL